VGAVEAIDALASYAKQADGDTLHKRCAHPSASDRWCGGTASASTMGGGASKK